MPRQTVLVAILVVTALTVFTGSVGAADLPRQLQVGEHRLVLNGWGARTKTFLQLYIAGLYLTRPSTNPRAIASANEPMAIRIQITSGFVSQEKLVASLSEGFHNATGGNVAPIQRQIDQFRQCFKDPITKGDAFDIVYVPEYGVAVNKNSSFKGVVAGLAFKEALFNVWLSDNPADKNLKQAMLTRRTTR